MNPSKPEILSRLCPKLNLPSFDFRIATKEGKPYIFDSFRKKNIVLTSEEWVRQNFLKWLTEALEYPKGLVGVEVSLKYHKLDKRADAIIYQKEGIPLMLIECKAPEIKITQKTFEQAAAYNFSLRTPYMAMTNGLQHYCCLIDFKNYSLKYLKEIPAFKDLVI